MSEPENRDSDMFVTARASLIMLCFGLGILAYLIVIDRREWFHVRPVSPGAAGMSQIAAKNAPPRSIERIGAAKPAS